MKFNFFLPQQPVFFDLFANLSQEILNVSYILRDMSKASHKTELDNFALQAKEIEHRADETIHKLVIRLNKTFITPFDREDIYSLASELDDIVDKIENVIHNIVIYNVDPHEDFLAGFAEIIVKDAEFMAELIALLKSQKYSDNFRDLVVKIHSLEDEGDELFIKVLKSLFSNGQDAIAIIKLKDIAEDLEKVTDRFQTASFTIENIFVKNQ